MPGSYLLNTNSKFILSYSNHVFFLIPISQVVPMSVFSILWNLTSIMFTEQSFSNYVLRFKKLDRNSHIQQFSVPTASSTVAEPSTKTDHNWMCKMLVTGCFVKSPQTQVFSLTVTTLLLTAACRPALRTGTQKASLSHLFFSPSSRPTLNFLSTSNSTSTEFQKENKISFNT